MKIFFGKYSGSNIEELDSSYLIQVIEEFDTADWTLVQACKTELAKRLKLDWSPVSEREFDLECQVLATNSLNTKLLKQVDTLEKCLLMATTFGANRITIDGYLCTPQLLDQDLKIIKQINEDRAN